MIHEIDASTIISHLVSENGKNKVVIEISKVKKLGCIIEKKHPSIVIDTDKYAFHSFKNIDAKAIKIQEARIIIDRTHSLLRKRIERMAPSAEVKSLITEAETCL